MHEKTNMVYKYMYFTIQSQRQNIFYKTSTNISVYSNMCVKLYTLQFFTIFI